MFKRVDRDIHSNVLHPDTAQAALIQAWKHKLDWNNNRLMRIMMASNNVLLVFWQVLQNTLILLQNLISDNVTPSGSG